MRILSHRKNEQTGELVNREAEETPAEEESSDDESDSAKASPDKEKKKE